MSGNSRAAPSRSGTFLSWDILYDLASYLPKPSLIALMSTCKELRNAGARALLGEHGPISFGSAAHIESFLRFITSSIAGSSGDRGTHIRSLDLRTSTEKSGWVLYDLSDPPVLKDIVEILRLASGLEALHISGFAEWLGIFRDHLQAFPSIFSALRRLQFSIGSLQTLGSEWRPEKIAEVLRDVKHIPLKVLVVDSYFEDSNFRQSIAQLFSIFANTIEELHVSNSIFILPPIPPEPTHSGRTLRFPCVQTLSVSGLYWTHSSLTDLGSIISCFPNVKSIAFGPPFYCIPIGRRNPLWWQAAMMATSPNTTILPHRTTYSLVSMTNVQPPAIIRDGTLREQHKSIQQHTRWTSLDYLGGCCDHLYGLAISSKVERLDIYDIITIGTPSSILQVNAILHDCSPTKLSLVVTYPEQPNASTETQGSEIADLLPRPLSCPLQYLQINVQGSVDAKPLCSQLPGLVAKATGIKTVVVTHNELASFRHASPWEEHDIYQRHRDFALRLAALSPTLHYLGLPGDLFGASAFDGGSESCGTFLELATPVQAPLPNKMLYWAIERTEDGDICVDEILPDVAAAIVLEPADRAILTSAFERLRT